MAKSIAKRQRMEINSRLSAQERRTRKKEAKARIRGMQNLVLAAIGIMLVGLIGFFVYRNVTVAPPGQFVPSLGNAHPWATLPNPTL
jgi:hypothetical protein